MNSNNSITWHVVAEELTPKDYADALIEPPQSPTFDGGQIADNKRETVFIGGQPSGQSSGQNALIGGQNNGQNELWTLTEADKVFLSTVFSWTIRVLFVGFCLVGLVHFSDWFVQELSPLADSLDSVMPKLKNGLEYTFWCAFIALGIYGLLQIWWLDQKMS